MTFTAFDSYTGEEFPTHRIFAVSYEPFWQAIRQGMSWKYTKVVVQNIARFDAYIGLARTDQERTTRIWRCANLLRAIPVAQTTEFGAYRTDMTAQDLIVMKRDELRDMAGKPTEWDWHITRINGLKLWKKDPDRYKEIYQDLVTQRTYRGGKKPELYHFLGMTKHIMEERWILSDIL